MPDGGRVRTASLRPQALFVFVALAATMAIWFAAAMVSPRTGSEVWRFLVVQFALQALALLALVWTARSKSAAGPGAGVFFSLHVLLYYGLSNIVPAILPNLRPAEAHAMISDRMPAAGLEAWTAASLAAILLFLGGLAGVAMGRAGIPEPSPPPEATRPLPWLPGARTSTLALAVLVVLVALGTFRYALNYAVVLSDEAVSKLRLPDQLLFHGLFWYLPLGPGLAAAAYVQSRRRSRGAALVLVLVSGLLVSVLVAWRMRSTAMISMVLPLLLLAMSGILRWRRWAVPGIVLLAGSYALITAVRISNLESTVARVGGKRLGFRDIVRAVFERPGDGTVAGRAIFDLSYRTAGLEPVAALVEAEMTGVVECQRGRVTASGLLQSLPAALRPSPDIPLRLKTAPSKFGLFTRGDWLSTFLAEAVLDFGVFGAWIYGLFVGLVISLAERLILRAGYHPALEGLLIVRFAFLLYLVREGSDLATATTMFAKATAGYTVLLVLVGALAHAMGRPDPAVPAGG